jgi:serine/threonine protein kinase/Tfp pilus assembly protein PilF
MPNDTAHPGWPRESTGTAGQAERVLVGESSAPDSLRASSSALNPRAPGSVCEVAPQNPPPIPDHELIRRIGGGSYGEVWLARNALGALRAVKIVHRRSFSSERPFEREFNGIQKFEPISRSHDSQVDILHVGRNGNYFYYVMELADDAGPGTQAIQQSIDPSTHASITPPLHSPTAYMPRTLKLEVSRRGRLPVSECVEIGIALTTAVAHLHKHGLVHRDVKPSNVIFIKGVPKLADIGLVTDSDATVSCVGTEGFLPPEGPGTPQGDLYALGKVLYEISTGKDRQDYPEPPTLLGEFPDRPQLLELGEIIKKACAPQPARRYQTAEGMQADLLLLLAGRSVRRTHELERNFQLAKKIALATISILVLAVAPYLLAIKEARDFRLEASRARAAQEQAQVEAAKNQQVAQFLQRILQEGARVSADLGQDTGALKDLLHKAVEDLSSQLTNQPDVRAQLLHTIAGTYISLEEYELAEGAARQALAIRTKRFGDESLPVAESLDRLGETLRAQRKTTGAETAIRSALDLREKLLGREHRDVAYSLNNLFSVLLHDGKLPEAEAVERRALSIWRRTSDEENIAVALNNLGRVLLRAGNQTAAEHVLREALAIHRKLDGDLTPAVRDDLENLVADLMSQGKNEEAKHLIDEVLTPAVEGQIKSLGLLEVRAGFFARCGRWSEAAADLERAIKYDPANPRPYQELIPLLLASGDSQSSRHYQEQAIARFGETRNAQCADRVAKSCLLLPTSDPLRVSVLKRLADFTVEQGQGSSHLPWFEFCKALAEYRQNDFRSSCLWAAKSVQGPERPDLACLQVAAYAVLSMGHFGAGEVDLAHAALAEALQRAHTNLRSLETGDVGGNWKDWLIAHILLGEARSLIDGYPKAGAGSTVEHL